jgi:hypothetical protein
MRAVATISVVSFVLSLVAIPAAQGQAVISARSGLVNFVDGDVRLAGQRVKLDGAIFPDVKIGEVLSTQSGRAEILLTPGVFLRLDKNTSFRMASNKLTDTQVEILSGSALIEADEILKDNRIAVKMGDSETLLLKTGLYHFNADAGQVRAFDGRAQVSDASNSTELKGGRTLLVGSSLTTDKFNKKKSKDELYAWSEERDAKLYQANIAVARRTGARTLSSSLWAWDPALSMYTFLPRSGYINSPFGIPWYSPEMVWVAGRPVNFPDNNSVGSSAGSSWQGVAPSAAASVAPSSNASTGVVAASSGSSSSAVAASAGGARGR